MTWSTSARSPRRARASASTASTSRTSTPTRTDFPSTHTDLLNADVATLATIDDDGLPQLTEVWFIHDGGELRLSLNGERFKTANLKARGACSLLILDLANPYRYLEVRGTARV